MANTVKVEIDMGVTDSELTFQILEDAVRLWVGEFSPPIEDKLKLIHAIRSSEEVFVSPRTMIRSTIKKQIFPETEGDTSRNEHNIALAGIIKRAIKLMPECEWDDHEFWDETAYVQEGIEDTNAAVRMIAMLFNLILTEEAKK